MQHHSLHTHIQQQFIQVGRNSENIQEVRFELAPALDSFVCLESPPLREFFEICTYAWFFYAALLCSLCCKSILIVL